MKFYFIKILCLYLLIVSGMPLPATNNNIEKEYSVKNIPSRLLNNSRIVVRKYDVQFKVENYSNAVETVKKAVTIFNKEGQDYGKLSLWYDVFREIDDIEGVIYDAAGEEIRDLESKDIKDYSDFESYSVYNDNRIKYIEMYYDKFPYTVEYTYVIRYDGYLSWPSWYSRYSKDPVEETSFEVITPPDYKLRYWCNEDKSKPEVTNSRNEKIYRWYKYNLTALPDEVIHEDIEDFASIVHIAPTDFEIGGYKGNMDTWKDLGYWYSSLSKGKDKLPQEALNEIHNIISSTNDEKERVNLLYRFMQSRSRYVSVQLGIGGWQPYDAEYVHSKGYGDCKALSNYMISLLKYSGIEAYPVLIRNGHYAVPLIEDFPSNQFNHVIVCVPLEYDTLWLECTSQKMPAGSIGWSNENRNALIITPDGGIVVRTPGSEPQSNIQLKNINVTLQPNGEADIKSLIRWFGNQHDYVIHVAHKTAPNEQEKWIKNLLDVSDIQLHKYSFNQSGNQQNEINLTADFALQRYASISGKRIFFNPNLMERRKSVPANVSKRISPVRLRYPYLDIDSVRYILPQKYKVEAVPKEVNLSSSFGSYISKTTDNGDGSVLFIRSLEMRNYIIPPENYQEYQKFFADVVKADKQQVVLVKSE